MHPLLNPSIYFEQSVSKDLWYNVSLVRDVMSCEQEKRLILKNHFKTGNKCGLEDGKDVAWWQGGKWLC